MLYDDRVEQDRIDQKARLDLVTRLLCELMTNLERYSGGSLPASPELLAWWEEHKKMDAERKARGW